MARWNEEQGQWEGGRERDDERGWRGREDRGAWRSDDTWRGGGWREGEEREGRDEWRREGWHRGGEGRLEGMGREPGGRAEWDRLRGRDWDARQRGARHAGGRAYGQGWEPRERERTEGGGWRRSTQFEPSGEGPGSYGHEDRYGRDRGGFGRSDARFLDEPSGRGEYGAYMGSTAGRRGEGEGRWEARSDFGRGEYHGRSDWGRGGEERGPMERLGERMKEGWRKMTGRGPKGYKRSDERIREDVSEQIARSNIDADEVEVKVERAEVTLTGFVESRWDKRMLEDIAEDVFGVDEVHNHLRLRQDTGARAGEATAGQTTQPGMSGQTMHGQARAQQPASTQPDLGTRGHH
ncbi:MAG TPA: BON domain-containing protein [Anaeromyxobacter sp.]|nr:BON domain-containing protein [Anaeromyxobacter sp.]